MYPITLSLNLAPEHSVPLRYSVQSISTRLVTKRVDGYPFVLYTTRFPYPNDAIRKKAKNEKRDFAIYIFPYRLIQPAFLYPFMEY